MRKLSWAVLALCSATAMAQAASGDAAAKKPQHGKQNQAAAAKAGSGGSSQAALDPKLRQAISACTDHPREVRAECVSRALDQYGGTMQR